VTTRLDFWSIGQAALAEAERLLADVVAHGKREGQEWVSLNPTRDDSTPGSFKINLRTQDARTA
jgi:putative DNA primase/helicase